eukprot:TRINITY_DN3297_c0_g1_i1.p1 TRINITY_DN3297_c0_g1~~TRINITY_DN3297_c0_g1_i1.p1  ORF type:complete len:428 (-),score=69.38 TRINITY_DN3297_c0_g1_i1:15-1298(-)
MYFQKKKLNHTNSAPDETSIQHPLLDNFFNFNRSLITFQHHSNDKSNLTVSRVSFRQPTLVNILERTVPLFSLYGSLSRVVYDKTAPIFSAAPPTESVPSLRPLSSVQFDFAGRNYFFDVFKQYHVPGGSNRYGFILTNHLHPIPQTSSLISPTFQLYSEQLWSPTPLSPSTPQLSSSSPHLFSWRNLIGLTSFQFFHLASSLRLKIPFSKIPLPNFLRQKMFLPKISNSNFFNAPNFFQFLEIGYDTALYKLDANLIDVRSFLQAVVNLDFTSFFLENKIRYDGIHSRWLFNLNFQEKNFNKNNFFFYYGKKLFNFSSNYGIQMGVEFDRLWNGIYPMKVGLIFGGGGWKMESSGEKRVEGASWKARLDFGREKSLSWEVKSMEVWGNGKGGGLRLSVNGSAKMPYETSGLAALERVSLGLGFIFS